MGKTYTVFGLGTFGWQTARALYRRGATVLAIDRHPDMIERIKDSVTQAVCADATDLEALTAVGAYEVDAAVVAFRRHFDTSVLVTHALHQHGVRQILVQVNSVQEEEAIRVLGATESIFAERDMAENIARKLTQPSLVDEVPLGDGVGIIKTPCPPDFVGKSLVELNIRRNYGVHVVGLKRMVTEEGPESGIRMDVAPSPDQPLSRDSELIVLGNDLDLEKFLRACRKSR